MTIREAIGRVDGLKHNTYTNAEKTAWLSRLDGKVKTELIDTHEGGSNVKFDGYTPETNPDTVLLVGEPYDEIYLRWLEAQIDYHNGEIDKYNNSIMLFQAAYNEFSRYYNRTHMHVGTNMKYF